MKPLLKIYDRLIHYFQERGKDELKSFLTTFLAGFIASMMIFATSVPSMLWDPTIMLTDIAFELYRAAVRSAFAALLFSFMPTVFPLRASKK